MKTFKYLLFFFIIGLSACKIGGSEPANTFSWLKGRWEATDQVFRIQEEWTMEGDSMLAGYDKAIALDNKIVMEEHMGICKRQDTLYYLLTLNRQLVPFKFSQENDPKPNEFIFTNPNPGFPERIVLKKTDDEGFIAAIEGGKGETHIRREMAFKKIK